MSQKSNHFDIMFRFDCPCGQTNAPIFEIKEFDTSGFENIFCQKCKREYKVNWDMKINAELAEKTDPDVEAIIWDDTDED